MFSKRILKQSIALLAALVLIFSSIGLTPTFANETKNHQETTYAGEGYEVIYQVTNSWGDAFNADVTIKNTSDHPIDNWALGFALPYEITNIWNGNVQSHEDDEYVIKNAGSNQNIASGKSVTFGFTAQLEGELVNPTTFDLLGTEEIIRSEQYETSFKVTSDWKQAFNGEILIKNTSQTTIEDWKLDFDFEGNIDQFWTAEIIERQGNRYTIKNAGYNANIKPGETVTLGFAGNPGGVTSEPSNYQLTHIVIKQEAPVDVSVDFDTSGMELQNSSDGDYYFLDTKKDKLSGTLEGTTRVKSLTYQISDKDKTILQQGDIPVHDVWSLEGIGLGVGYNLLTFNAQLKDGTKVTKEYIIVNFDASNLNNLGIDQDKDTDTDGIPDYYEERYGLSVTDKDTDGDGLSDLDEILALRLNPLEQDSDKNGTLDGDEDSDSDGLSNVAELANGTSFISADTDGDGLIDGEEVHTYKTDPLKADTDGDKLSDGWEVKIGSDPLVVGERFTRTVHIEDDQATAIPSVTVEGISAEQVDSLSVNIVEDGILNDTTIPGYIDNGYNFSINGTFEKATLSFQFDEQLLERVNFDPRIYYYNEETQALEELPNQQVDGNVVSVETEHFSKYILLNKTEYDQVWQYKFLFDEEEEQYSGMDIAFVIDSSGSMLSNDRNNVRVSVTKEFINKLTENDRGAVVDFDSYANVLSDFTNDKASLSGAAEQIDSSGGTNLSSGIVSALDLFAGDERNDVLKYIIMLTDGQGSYDTSLTTRAANNDLVIYTVGLGSNVSSSVLTAMAEGTGGGYYHANNAEQLYGIFDTIAETSDLYKDTDMDGISDYHEKEMQAGRLRLSTGGAISRVNYLNADSDDDGLKDGEEVRITKVGDKVYAYLYSNPSMKDTDGDGLNDNVDKRRLIPDLNEALIHQSDNYEGRLKGVAEDDYTVSDDLIFNDYTFKELVEHGWVFSVAEITPEFMIWGEMAVLFDVAKIGASSDMKVVLDDLVSTFRNGNRNNEGTSVSNGDQFNTDKYIKYKNSKLDNAVMSDASTKKYVDLIHNFTVQHLQENNGDLSQLEYIPNAKNNVVYNYVYGLGPRPYPIFTEKSNLALSLAIHAFHGHNITIKEFRNDGNQFSGKIVFHFYDHFGLDSDDEIVWPGFVDWFTLQHYDRFNGKYVPFITTIDYEMDFSGTIK